MRQVVAMDDAFLDTDADHKHDLTVSSVGIVIEGEFFPDKVHVAAAIVNTQTQYTWPPKAERHRGVAAHAVSQSPRLV